MSGCEGGSCSTCDSGNPDRLPPGMLRRYDINQSTADGTLVVIETVGKGDDVKVSEASAGLLAKAREMTEGRLFAVVFGGLEVKPLYPEIFGYGVDTLYHVRDQRLETYIPEAYSECLAAVVDRIEPAAVLFNASQYGREVAPRLAASLGVGLTADCTGLSADGRKLIATRPAFGGTLMADIEYIGFPQIATVRPGAFPAPERKEGQGTAIYWQYTGDSVPDGFRDSPVENGGDDIGDARIVISLGDGIRDRSVIEVAERVCGKMGAALCCSRALVEKGWMPRSRQVGMSGRIVNPDLYIAFGISGAVQHRVGMNGAKRIIAVNDDPDAPIHGFADVSLLADAGEVLRSLEKSLLRARYGAGEDLVDVTVDLDVAPDRLDLPVLPDEERRADGSDGLLAVGLLDPPGPDRLQQGVVGVAEELDLQLLVVDEAPVGFGRILADPDDGDVPEHELGDAGGERLRLPGASGGAVLRVEVDHVPDALEGGAVQLLAVLVLEPEARECIAYFHGIRTGCPSS